MGGGGVEPPNPPSGYATAFIYVALCIADVSLMEVHHILFKILRYISGYAWMIKTKTYSSGHTTLDGCIKMYFG